MTRDDAPRRHGAEEALLLGQRSVKDSARRLDFITEVTQRILVPPVSGGTHCAMLCIAQCYDSTHSASDSVHLPERREVNESLMRNLS